MLEGKKTLIGAYGTTLASILGIIDGFIDFIPNQVWGFVFLFFASIIIIGAYKRFTHAFYRGGDIKKPRIKTKMGN